MRAMFASRKQFFIDRLGWNIRTLAGEHELDKLDDTGAC